MDGVFVTRSEFVYRDTLFVDIGGEGKRHPRAAEAELKGLLNGKASQKDQVGHWYEAQLIHYGLQRSKDKNTAKVRLQQALNQGKLKVPPHISDMEAQMKKEYAAGLRKAKKAAGGDSTDAATPKTTKRRKNDEAATESSKKTKISLNNGDIATNIEHAAQGSANAKSSKVAESAVAKAVKKTTVPKQAGKTASTDTTSKPLKRPKSKLAAPQYAGSPSTESPGAKSTNLSSPSKPAVAKKESVEAKPTAKAQPKVKPEPKIKPEPKVKPEPHLARATPVKREQQIKSEDGADAMDIDSFAQEQPGPRNVTGVYNISCPQLEEQLPDHANAFRMFLCVDEGMVWGGFELGMKSGVLRADEIQIDQPVSFGWRARDSWKGDLTFGRLCFGEIELYGHERVRGTFHNLFNEPMVFEGQRRPGPLWCGRSPYSFQKEWDGFVSEAYGR